MENREEERNLLDAAGIEGRVLVMKDAGQPVGWVAVDLREGTLHLVKLDVKGYDFTEKPQGETLFILDTLMRSAASRPASMPSVRAIFSASSFLE